MLESCRTVSERAARTLQWAENHNVLLDIALGHLTLGRAALHAAILEGIPLDQLDPRRVSLDRAVDGLRRVGQQPYLSLGLLTRAWPRFLTGVYTGPDSAQSDLDEAFEITERGPMPLFLADIHLHRARLFGLSKADGRRDGNPLQGTLDNLPVCTGSWHCQPGIHGAA